MTEIGYCTNVHAAATLDQTRANLQQHAVAVRRQLGLTDPMGIGLWLPSSAASETLAAPDRLREFRAYLEQQGLLPFTLNGFPFGDFHRAVVKHDVYFPTWWDSRRADYTLQLVEILHELLPAGCAGSISTLPISWGQPQPTESEWQAAAAQLCRVARRLAELERARGRHIVLSLEPEPGCALQRSEDVVTFFERYLWPLDRPLVERYLGVCHDVCHAVVMFETQQDVLERYRAAGIRVGKVQISSAVRMSLDQLPGEERGAAVAELSQFTEDRYLHQTVIGEGYPGEVEVSGCRFFEDLPLALGYYAGEVLPAGQWHVHFHVPVYLERFGRLESSRADIEACTRLCQELDLTSHFEVETYAWQVLPPELRVATLADGIAREMAWFRGLVGSG